MNDAHKDYFETAYRTGSDIWTHLPYQPVALSMMPRLQNNAMVLDVGSGRGVWVRKLVSLGLRVIGIDYAQEAVNTANEDLKYEEIQKNARFVLGDVRDIPFADASFDAVTDIGLLQHLHEEDWSTYAAELSRVLKKDGYVLSVTLSRETTRFLEHNPKTAPTGKFEKFGLNYYFFTEEELNEVMKSHFVVVRQQVRFFDTRTDPDDGVAMIFTLFQKK